MAFKLLDGTQQEAPETSNFKLIDDKPRDFKLGKFLVDEVKATPSVVGSTVAGLLSWPVQKSFGVMELIKGGTKEDAIAAEEFVASKIPSWLQPKGDSSTAAMEKFGTAIDFALTPARMSGEAATKMFGEKTGYLTALAAELAMFKIGHIGKTSAKIKLQKTKAAKDLGKKVKTLNPNEKFFVEELVKQHKLKPHKPVKQQEEVPREYSDNLRDEFKHDILKDTPEIPVPKTPPVKPTPVKPAVVKPVITEQVKKGAEVKEKVPAPTEPVKPVVTKIEPKEKVETPKQKVEQVKKESSVEYKQSDLVKLSIRTKDGTVYSGPELSQSWSISKPKIAIEEGPKSLSAARKAARQDGQTLFTKRGEPMHEKGFLIGKAFLLTQ